MLMGNTNTRYQREWPINFGDSSYVAVVLP